MLEMVIVAEAREGHSNNYEKIPNFQQKLVARLFLEEMALLAKDNHDHPKIAELFNTWVSRSQEMLRLFCDPDMTGKAHGKMKDCRATSADKEKLNSTLEKDQNEMTRILNVDKVRRFEKWHYTKQPYGPCITEKTLVPLQTFNAEKCRDPDALEFHYGHFAVQGFSGIPQSVHSFNPRWKDMQFNLLVLTIGICIYDYGTARNMCAMVENNGLKDTFGYTADYVHEVNDEKPYDHASTYLCSENEIKYVRNDLT